MRKEILLGGFILGGLITLAILIVLVKHIPLKSGYHIHVYFNNVGTLLEKASVRAAGVKIGEVRKISLVGKKAKVTLWIKKGVKLYKDARVSILSTGIIGTQYIEVFPGSPKFKVLKNGDSIFGIDPLSLENTVSKGISAISSLASALEGVKESKITDLNKLISDLRGLTASINNLIGNKELKSSIHNLNSLLKKLNRIVEHQEDSFSQLVNNLNNATTEIRELVMDIKQKIESKKNIVGKLLSDETLPYEVERTASEIKRAISAINDFAESLKNTSKDSSEIISAISQTKLYLNYRLKYNQQSYNFYNEFGAFFTPTGKLVCYFGINSPKFLSRAIIYPYLQGEYDFDIWIGKPFWGMTFYGGIIRSSGGVGFRYSLFPNDEVFGSTNIDVSCYDFNIYPPFLNIRLSIRLLSWIYVGISIEDLIGEGTIFPFLNIRIK